MDQKNFPKMVEHHLRSTYSQVFSFHEICFISTDSSTHRLVAVVENASRGALGLFQPVLYSHDAEAFIEGSFEDLEKATQSFLKEPDCEVGLPPTFLVRDVLLVISLSRSKPQATCGVCYMEQGSLVWLF